MLMQLVELGNNTIDAIYHLRVRCFRVVVLFADHLENNFQPWLLCDGTGACLGSLCQLEAHVRKLQPIADCVFRRFNFVSQGPCGDKGAVGIHQSMGMLRQRVNMPEVAWLSSTASAPLAANMSVMNFSI